MSMSKANITNRAKPTNNDPIQLTFSDFRPNFPRSTMPSSTFSVNQGSNDSSVALTTSSDIQWYCILHYTITNLINLRSSISEGRPNSYCIGYDPRSFVFYGGYFSYRLLHYITASFIILLYCSLYCFKFQDLCKLTYYLLSQKILEIYIMYGL